ncbi:MAG: 16S rRNA (guanine(527)-N(7))-methyltransferase RsmG [Candidatus Peribacteraceae bacterium]|nr:16S rRNA (guanine(527)-N(7))-methyltransferase RsmG [Candidatus Peribacteraceae bacterium]
MINSDQQNKLNELCTIFLEENSKLNLSAFRTQENCFIGNIMDCVAVVDAPEFKKIMEGESIKILDIGTGGGFPLLPLAILYPNSKLIGLDSVQKKVDAVKRITEKLSLSNVDVISGRTEELGRDENHREKYDIVTARALAPLNTLLEYASAFVAPNGLVIAWKSLNIDKEIKDSLMARAELSCQLEKSFEYNLGEKWGKRQLLIFRKRAPLNKKYPREVGIPKKKPLI